MITQDLGIATAYGYAKSKGYTGTEAEFAELMASYASTAQTAIEAADRAVEANTAAQSAKTDAAASKTAAQTAAQTATSKASEAVTAAGTATTKASEASQSASTASAAATSAGTSAQTATTAATTATTKASEASESATTATAAKTDAETARDAAAQSASEAAASAESIDPEALEHKAYGAYVVESASGAIASFADGADNIPMKDVLVHIEPVQEGSGDPSPDNVRPITGWTGAKVTRCGKNMAEPAFESATKDGITAVRQSDGSYLFNGTATKETNFYLGSTDGKAVTIPIPRNTPLAISGCPDGAGGSTWQLVAWHYKGDTYLNRSTQEIGRGATINDTEADGIRFSMQIKNGATCENLVFKPMLRLASDTDSTYEPYSGSTYSITFPSEADTVYGGALDVTSGVLTVDRAMVKKSVSDFNETSSTSTTGRFFIDVAPYNSGTFVSWNDNLSNIVVNSNTSLLQVNQMYVQSGFRVQLKTAYTSKDELVSAMGDNLFEFCGKLVTPITYQLTSQEMQEITSLLGENNLWADTGDSEVEYRADTKMYITKKIADAVSALS